MKTLEEIMENLQGALTKYENLPLDDVNQLSEILRTLDVNLAFLVHVRDEYYHLYQSTYFNSNVPTNAGKEREAMREVSELDLVRKILKHYGETQKSIRSQISLRKNQDR
jgi:hypothetical protein